MQKPGVELAGSYSHATMGGEVLREFWREAGPNLQIPPKEHKGFYLFILQRQNGKLPNKTGNAACTE